jgi:SAM-dependent methyltransferase
MSYRAVSDDEILELQRLEPRIPSPLINYNQAPSENLSEYIKEFKTRACLKELPFLIERAGLTPSSAFLDYGCGYGRLAYAASNYLDAAGAYFGYDINLEAIRFLKNAYADLSNFKFEGSSIRLADDYIAIAQGASDKAETTADDIDISQFLAIDIDVQWTSSVFSHMWQSSIIKVLDQIRTKLSPGGVCVNTWLIIDHFASYTMKCGLADRALPFKINGAWTYLKDNPLMCTAYELADVQAMYAQAGHEITDILWGSWSGRGNPATYLDVVISKPVQINTSKRGWLKTRQPNPK